MIRKLFSLLAASRQPKAPPSQRKKLFFDDVPAAIYAVGDVHGCYDQLQQLEERIFRDAAGIEGRKWLVMLGDYVDRGPKSASVMDRLTEPPGNGFERYCLAGNHEEAMLDFFRNPSPNHPWLGFGGQDTLRSYGIARLPANRQAAKQMLDSYIPVEHQAFLEGLPSLIALPGVCFVHAGLEAGVPLQEQRDEVLLWTRPVPGEATDEAAANGPVVIHGHTPVAAVDLAGRRINVDTGAYMTGVLSAVRLTGDGRFSLLQTG